MSDLSTTISETFPTKKIVIVGDIVADQFLKGTVSRLSREAPVFIVKHDATETLPGGAANAAINVAGLKARTVLIGVTGNDQPAAKLFEAFDNFRIDSAGILSESFFSTTSKVRVLAGQPSAQRQQMVRIDYENKYSLRPEHHFQIEENLAKHAEDADAIILSDYNYGVVDGSLCSRAREISRKRGIPLLVDSRFRLREFPDVTSATPNQEEAEQLIGGEITPEACRRIQGELACEALLITRGSEGMLLVEQGRPIMQIDPIGSTEPVDVTGAGDTVIAVYALGLAAGLCFLDAARVADHAGGIVVMKKGTSWVTPEDLARSVEQGDKVRELE